jgi:L-alanine-DL-glutamate epimerase-like enolase superfamily enzyme
MRIEAVDFYYLSMPEVLDIGDGSQDLLLVRLQAGPHVGWGECEASPLVSIASLVCPMSHSACKPVRDSVLGQTLDDVADIDRIGDLVRANSMDLLQSNHTLSGIDIAMWDLLGRRFETPVYELLGYARAEPRQPYASVLFGDTPAETLAKARGIRGQGYRAAKFGWGPYGRDVAEDAAQVAAAREGLGADGIVLVDGGTVWGHDLAAAEARLPALQKARVSWLEEPFVSGALDAYRALAERSGSVRIAGGEGSHNEDMARHMIDHGGVGYIQIDAGRIGGIAPAKRVADYAAARGVTYVNHTFTSHLALSASLQPYAGHPAGAICEYPLELKSLAWEITHEHIARDADGMVRPPAAPGLGMTPDLEAAKRYLRDVEIAVGGRTLYRTPELVGQPTNSLDQRDQ